MHLFNAEKGIILQNKNVWYWVNEQWDTLINRENLYSHLMLVLKSSKKISDEESKEYLTEFLLAPVTTQEVWAAGVTYLRSRNARIDESKESGASDCYSKVYEAERPELFFKALAHSWAC